MIFLGIDPGVSGAIAVVRREDDCVGLLKLKNATPTDIHAFITSQPDISGGVIEKVASSPQMGVRSAFTFGRSFGLLEGMLFACQICHEQVPPGVWQKTMACRTGGDKNISKRRAEELFPSVKVTHWNADALLLALYARRRFGDVTV